MIRSSCRLLKIGVGRGVLYYFRAIFYAHWACTYLLNINDYHIEHLDSKRSKECILLFLESNFYQVGRANNIQHKGRVAPQPVRARLGV